MFTGVSSLSPHSPRIFFSPFTIYLGPHHLTAAVYYLNACNTLPFTPRKGPELKGLVHIIKFTHSHF